MQLQSKEPLLGNSQIQRYQQAGYLAVEGLISEEELASARAAIDTAVVQRTAEDRRSMAEKTRYEQSFVQCMRLWEDHPEVAPFTFHPLIAQAAAELMGVDCARLWQDQALYKEAGGAATTAHQDQSFWPIGDAPLVSAWVALTDVTRENGAMGYVPGSHLAGRLQVVDITHQSQPYDILQDTALGVATTEWVEASAGTVIFHHGYCVHQAGPNQTTETRRAMTMVYYADGTIREKDWPVFGLDRAKIAVGEPIEGLGLPVAWPREDNALPEAPSQLGAKVGFGFERK